MRDASASPISPPGADGVPDFREALRVWARIGVLSFGGPAAQIALMHRVVVEDRKWLTEKQFLNALSFCMLLPGPEAMQLATYAGWRLHGVAGGLAAGLLFVLPGAFVVLALAIIYALFGNVTLVAALFFGIKAAVLVIVFEALMRIARRALTRWDQWAIAVASFVGLFAFSVPFPLILLVAGAIGFLRARVNPSVAHTPMPNVPIGQTISTISLWLAIWIVPLAVISAFFGTTHVLSQLALFFSKLAVVTFGGAYAVLGYMAETVVAQHGWIETGHMLDGLGLAETTPGPLILVTEFIGFLAAFRHGGGDPILMGVLGAIVALWATFAPCFLWIFAGAPYIEWLNSRPRLQGALTAITAAVVGVILNLSLWFALHVFFARLEPVVAGPVKLMVPDVSSLDWSAVAIAVVAGFLLLRQHWGVPAVLGVSALLALAVKQVGL